MATDVDVGTGAISAMGNITGAEILVGLQSGAPKELVLSRLLYKNANSYVGMVAGGLTGISADADGTCFLLGSAFYSGQWRNTVTGQGGAAIRNSSGVFSILTGSNPGAAGSVLSDMNTRLTIGGAGNVVISATASGYPLDVQGSVNTYCGSRVLNYNSGSAACAYFQLGNDTNQFAVYLGLNSSTGNAFLGGPNALSLNNAINAPVVLGQNGAERMRLATTGNIIAGASAGFDATVSATLNVYGASSALALKASGTTNTIASFYNDSGSARVGYIGTSGSSTSYNTSSDYRLKTVIGPISDAVERLCDIPAIRFEWLNDPGRAVDGFLAHEVQAVVPEAVTGLKDGMEAIGIATSPLTAIGTAEPPDDEDGALAAENITEAMCPPGWTWSATGFMERDVIADVPELSCPEGWTWEATGTRPLYQGIDQSKLVPLLVAAVQELAARVASLEAALAA